MSEEQSFESMLTGGHPNSLGNTIQVVETILADPARLQELYQCYFSPDAVVRLRVSNGMKRICQTHPDWLVPYLDRFLAEISQIDQASTQWTLASLFLMLQEWMDPRQKQQGVAILQRNLDTSDDWIVQNTTMETLAIWAQNDPELKAWLLPRLEQFTHSRRKSVAGRARKKLAALQK